MKHGYTAHTFSTWLPRRRWIMPASAIVLTHGAPAVASPPLTGSWSLWASAANGVPYGVFPTLAYSPETRTLYYSTRYTPSPSDTLGTVWSCKLNGSAPAFTRLPQTGLVLPTPKTGTAITNVFSMTTDSLGEPIIGTGAPGNTNSAQTGQTKLYRFDTASNQWVAPPLTAYAGQNIPTLQPNNLMYQLTRGPDGTIWGGGQWTKTYRSTDAGKTFTVIDEKSLLAQTDPAYYTTGYPRMAGGDGAIYGIRVAPNGYVYEGTETAGVIYSPDNGATWHPLDYDYTNPNSTMARASNVGNVAGLGFTKDGKIVVQGAPGTGPNPPVMQRISTCLIPSIIRNKSAPDFQTITWVAGRAHDHDHRRRNHVHQYRPKHRCQWQSRRGRSVHLDRRPELDRVQHRPHQCSR